MHHLGVVDFHNMALHAQTAGISPKNVSKHTTDVSSVLGFRCLLDFFDLTKKHEKLGGSSYLISGGYLQIPYHPWSWYIYLHLPYVAN